MRNLKTFRFLPLLIGGVIILAFAVNIRLFSLTHNVASDEYEQATLMVLAKIRTAITDQVNTSFPHMPAVDRQQLIQDRLGKAVRQDKHKLHKVFDQVNLQLLKNNPGAKHYLQESDSYYFLDLTRNILEQGDVSATVNGSRYFNTKMLAPLGYWEPQTWHPYIGAWVYKAAKFFNPDVDLMTGVGFTPVVLVPFVLAAFLLACYGLGCSWPTMLTAAAFFIFAPIYLQRSSYGWYDNDTYSVLFPALNLGLLFMALRTITHTKKTIFWSILAAFSFALFARFWTGWGFSWVTAMLSLGFISTRSFCMQDPNRKNIALVLITTGIGTLLFLAASIGIGQFIALFPFAFGELQKFILPGLNGWPDIFIVVGELHHATLKEAVMLTGGPIVFLTALVTGLIILKDAFARRKLPPDNLILLGAFSAVTLILALKAERFTILLITPLALLVAYGFEMLWRSKDIVAGKVKFSPAAVSGIFIALFLMTASLPVINAAKTIGALLHPIFNSAWDRALTKLREETPPNSVVNTWWSPGHFVKAIGERRVTFDGASIKGEQAYWLTKVYLSQDENEALGILRMLNTSSNKSVEFLQSRGWPLSKAIAAISHLITLPLPDASRQARKILAHNDAAALLSLTHAAPPPSYLLIYNEIVEGNVLLSYVGKWNFEKIEAINANPALIKQVPPKNSSRYIDFLWDLVGGQWRQSEALNPVGQEGSRIIFDHGTLIDTATMTASVNSPKFGRGVPASIIYLDETKGRVIEKPLGNATLTYSIVYFKDNDKTPRCILMDRILANSLIIKLYYFNGKGLEHFRPFSKEQTLSGRTRIFLYEIKWPEYF